MKKILLLFITTTLLFSCSKSESDTDSNDFSKESIFKTWNLEYTVQYNSNGKSSTKFDTDNTKYSFSKDKLKITSEKNPLPFAEIIYFMITSDNKKFTIVTSFSRTSYDVLELTSNKLVFKSTEGDIKEYHFNISK